MKEQIDQEAQETVQLATARQGRGAERLEELSEQGQTRASQPEGKRSGETK